MELVAMGETLICLTAAGRLPATSTLRKGIGGAESNTAIGLARLGRAVALVSRVGDDPFGVEIERTIRGEGVDTTNVIRSPHEPTGFMVKERRSPDDIHVFYYRQGSAASKLGPADVPEELIAQSERFHVSGITLALGAGPAAATHRALSLCKEHGVRVSFDPNFRSRLWSLDRARAACTAIFGQVDDLLIGEEEAKAFASTTDLEEAIGFLDRFDFRTAVVRRGPLGAVGIHDGSRIDRPAVEVAGVVDPVGAGDAFNAGYLHALMAGGDVGEAIAWGNVAASFVIMHPGDWEGAPTSVELRDRLDGGGGVTR